MTRADKAARDLQERFSLEEPFIDPEKIAIELGVTVIRQEADGRISGMLLRRNNRDVIGVNPIKSQTVQRFVLAHLLGHHQLHRTRPTLLDAQGAHLYGNLSCFPLDREEVQANQFAAALLMPELAVRLLAASDSHESTERLVGRLATHFDVSRAVMGHRLISLGLALDA